jgi:hypothetical protein
MTNPFSSDERYFGNPILITETMLTLTSTDAERPAEILKRKPGERSIDFLIYWNA